MADNVEKNLDLITAVLAGLCCIFTPLSAKASERALSVFPKYEGIWIRTADDGDQCKAADFQAHDNERLIRVFGHTLKMYEAGCNIVSVKPAKQLHTAQDFASGPMRLTLECDGEGENWRAQELWNLKRVADHDVLATANDAMSTIETYVRCP